MQIKCKSFFTDDFEGVWELLEKDTTGSGVPYTRQIQGDVLISKSAIQLDNTFKVAA